MQLFQDNFWDFLCVLMNCIQTGMKEIFSDLNQGRTFEIHARMTQ